MSEPSGATSSARMAGHVDTTQALEAYMRVNLRCADRRVTEKILHHTQVCSTFEEVSTERVSQSVRSHRLSDSGHARLFGDYPGYGTRRQAGSRAADEERMLGLGPSSACQFGPVLAQIFFEPIFCALIEQDDALTRSFANHAHFV